MTEFKVSVDWTRYKSKPTKKYQIADISECIGNNHYTITQDNLKSFVKVLSGDGITFCPATFYRAKSESESLEVFNRTTSLKRENNIEQTQLLVLDFDNDKSDRKVSWEQVKDRAYKYNLPPLFAYETQSSSSDNMRFRVAFYNDVPITDVRAAKIMQDALLTVFPEADPSSKAISRMYYGGRSTEPLHLDESMPTINIESLIRNMTLYWKKKHKNHYRRKVTEFAKRNKIKLTEKGLLDISIANDAIETQNNIDGKISPSNLYNITIIGPGENLPNYGIHLDDGTSTYSAEKTLKNHAEYRAEMLESIEQTCILFREFDSGER